jgi:hypothetical protein
MQITVIASGFSDIPSNLKKTLFHSVATPVKNTFSESKDIKDVKIEKEKIEPAIIIDDEVNKTSEDDDWGAVPAFLRRNNKR